MNRLATISCLVVLTALAACDGRATASGAIAAATVGPPSKELESCGATAQCGEGLRCLEQVCTRTARSMVGDYLGARGGRELAAGKTDLAIATFAEALATYDGEKLAVPPELDCAYGMALGRVEGNKDKAELAARVLHRCLLALPPGGGLRRAALVALTELEDDGFDPKQLARAQLADLYLTRPMAPSTDRLTVTVTAEPPPRAKSNALIMDRLGQADIKSALLGCWQHRFAAGARELTARLGLKVTYRASEYEDEPGTYTIAVAPAAPGDEAQACVRAAVEPALTGLKTLREALDTTLTVTVK
jgi:hypothetical protein